jgi:hypothetical protein
MSRDEYEINLIDGQKTACYNLNDLYEKSIYNSQIGGIYRIWISQKK